MITLNTNKDILIQIPRNHIPITLGATCEIRLTGFLSEITMTVPATVQTLTNVYLISITDNITEVGATGFLELLSNNEVVFTNDVFILHPVNTEDNTDTDNDAS